jgi:hypothetical protein
MKEARKVLAWARDKNFIEALRPYGMYEMYLDGVEPSLLLAAAPPPDVRRGSASPLEFGHKSGQVSA